MIRQIVLTIAAAVLVLVPLVGSRFIGFTDQGKTDALFSRCSWRGGVEITRFELPGPVAFECFKNGKLIDSYHTTR